MSIILSNAYGDFHVIAVASQASKRNLQSKFYEANQFCTSRFVQILILATQYCMFDQKHFMFASFKYKLVSV